MAKLTQLPPAVVRFLDALWRGDCDWEAQVEEFQAALQRAREYLARQARFTLHDRESAWLENARFLLDEAEAGLDRTIPSQVLEVLFAPLTEAARLMEQVEAERAKPHFSTQPVLNRFLMASAAWIQGRGQLEAVRAELAEVLRFAQQVEHLWAARAASLPAEVRHDLQGALELLSQGLQEASGALAASDAQALHKSLALLEAGGRLAEHLLEWEQARVHQLRSASAFSIPLLGPGLEQANREGPDSLRAFLEEGLPRLRQFWDLATPALLVPPAARAALLDEVELAWIEVAAGASESALIRLSDAFAAVADHCLPAPCEETPRLYFEAARARLRGTVPLATMEELLQWRPVGEEAAEWWSDYLETESVEALYAAVECLAAGEVSDVCPCCGQPEPCQSCRLSLAGRTPWEA